MLRKMRRAAEPTDAAAQLLHRIQLAHGLQQWRAEAKRLCSLFQTTRDVRHLRAYERHNAAMETWERNPES